MTARILCPVAVEACDVMAGAAVASEPKWAPSRRLSLAQARRHSARVRTLRTVFVTLAVGASAALVGALAGNAIENAGQSQRDLDGNEAVTMLNPRFSGRDKFGRPFMLTAETAQRQRGNPDLVELVNPRLVDELNRIVTAPRGVYDQGEETLELFGDVRAEEADGYVFSSTQAKVFVAENRVVGTEPLSGSGPIGDVRADTYEIMEDGSSIRLQGRVRTILYPDGRPQEE